MSENNKSSYQYNEHLTIAKWAMEDRPREKMERIGAEGLSNAELLAILIGSGSRNQSAVDLMKTVLNDCDNKLGNLGRMTVRELTQYKGMGPAKAITLLAACELGKRRASEKIGPRPELDSSEAVYQFMLPKVQDLDVEEFWLLMMNQHFGLIKAERLSHGGITETAADVRLIIKEVILNNATVLAVSHNHPSGSRQPSRNDDVLTREIQEACRLMRIFFMDHVIVTDGSYYSYHDHGKL